ncbi:MAG: hypothetical protein R3F14_23345 [Polyangiaceae bacterium]
MRCRCEIETMLSPGKAPPRLPSAVTRREPRLVMEPPSPPPPPRNVERAMHNPLEPTAADLELMAALAPVPSKRSAPDRPAWAPPKAPAAKGAGPLQARATTVAVLSSSAAAALKGVRPAPGARLAVPGGGDRGDGAGRLAGRRGRLVRARSGLARGATGAAGAGAGGLARGATGAAGAGAEWAGSRGDGGGWCGRRGGGAGADVAVAGGDGGAAGGGAGAGQIPGFPHRAPRRISVTDEVDDAGWGTAEDGEGRARGERRSGLPPEPRVRRSDLPPPLPAEGAGAAEGCGSAEARDGSSSADRSTRGRWRRSMRTRGQRGSLPDREEILRGRDRARQPAERARQRGGPAEAVRAE